MKKRTKAIIGMAILCASCAVAAGCASSNSPYSNLDKNGYSISVRYDANGGLFASRDSVTLVDVYPSDAVKSGVKLLAPGDAQRKNTALSTASRSGYSLAGWYQERELRTDANGNALDEDGNLVSVSGKEQGYSYNKRWNFDTDILKIEDYSYVNGEYTLILYAAWVPDFAYDFYAETDGAWTKYATYTFNPIQMPDSQSIALPAMDEDNVAMVYTNQFPQASGKTFVAAYKDADKTVQVAEDEKIEHAGVIDYEHGVALDNILSVYTEWKEGIWFNIYTAEQFVSKARADGCYNICAPLDFSDAGWANGIARGNFTGQILGNGYTLSNIEVIQSEVTQTYGGLFGRIMDGAVIKDVTFENAVYRLTIGSRINPASFGLFTGGIATGATIENVSVSGKLLVGNVYRQGTDENSYFTGYSIGLLSGDLTTRGIEYSITCELDLDSIIGTPSIEISVSAQDEVKVKLL